MSRIIEQVKRIFPSRSNQLVVVSCLCYAVFLVVVFFLPIQSSEAEIALSLGALEGSVCSFFFFKRVRSSRGRKRLGWGILAFYFVIVIVNCVRNLLSPEARISDPEMLLSAALVLVVSAFLLASDFISKNSRGRSVADAVWVGSVFFVGGYYVIFEPFWSFETTNLFDSLVFGIWLVIVVMSSFFFFISVSQAKDIPYGLALIGVAVLATCYLGTHQYWQDAQGITHEYLGPLDIGWHLSFALFCICSQVKLDFRQPKIVGVRQNYIVSVTVIPIVLAMPVFYLTSPSELNLTVLLAAVLLSTLAIRLLMISVENYKLNEQLELVASQDHLTGMPNRLALEEHLATVLRRTSVTILFIDLDHFKILNDKFGHEAGDGALRDVSKAIKETLRSSDYFARLGGDEFIVVVPGVIAEDKLQGFVARVKNATNVDYSFEGESVQISSTIGVSKAEKGTDPTLAIHQADMIMLTGKKTAKNSVYY